MILGINFFWVWELHFSYDVLTVLIRDMEILIVVNNDA
jgi:hypothetical protein